MRAKTIDELKNERLLLWREVNELNKKCADFDLSLIINRANEILSTRFRPVPKPWINAEHAHIHMPDRTGIYFIFRNGRCVYVGQAVNLNKRVRLRSHHILNYGDVVSFVECEEWERNFVESFYIGALRPELNFGIKCRFNLKQQTEKMVRIVKRSDVFSRNQTPAQTEETEMQQFPLEILSQKTGT